MVGKTMIASVAPKPDIDVLAEAESDAETEIDAPRPILASLAPPIIAEDPREPGTPPAKLFTYASAGGMSLPGFGHKAAKPVAAPLPEYQDAEVVSGPEADDDHPDALAYVPFEIAGLMTDASVTYSRTVAPLSPPDQQNLDYLFDDMDQPTSLHAAQELRLCQPGGGPALLRTGGAKHVRGGCACRPRADAAGAERPLTSPGKTCRCDDAAGVSRACSRPPSRSSRPRPGETAQAPTTGQRSPRPPGRRRCRWPP